MNKSRLFAILFGLVLVAGLAGLRAQNGFAVKTLRNLVFDQYQRLSPRKPQRQPVRVIDIDEASLKIMGQFPWPRIEFAKLTDRLTELGAAAIAFDILFSEPDRLSPSALLNRSDLKSWLKAKGKDGASSLPDNDRIFAQAISRAPVVIGFGTIQSGQNTAPPLKAGFAFTGKDTLSALPQFESSTPILPGLEKAAAGIGSISLSPHGTSDVVRKIPLMWGHGNKAWPGLALEALRLAQGASTFIVHGASDTPGIVQGIRAGAFDIDTNEHGELWLHFRKDDPALYVPAYKLLRAGKADDARLRKLIEGHIVLVGTSATGLLDIRTTALGETVPGISIHAQALEQILAQDFLWRPDWVNGAELLLVIVLGVLFVLSATLLAPVVSLSAGAAVAVLIGAGSWYGFSRYGFLFDPAFALFTGLVVHFTMTAYRYLITEREARFVRMAFSRYVSPAVLEEIEDKPDMLQLGGNTRDLTVMFVDVRNFTPLSESLEPQALVAFLNRLLDELSACVVDERGTIDKYIGDSIMAFWNAPLEIENHEERACRAALRMRQKMAQLNDDDAFGFHAAGYDFARIAIGVGINTGPAVAGNLGSKERFDYSIVGDAVNVAARVESACKEVGSDIVLAASTARRVAHFALLDAGRVELKGKSQAQQIFVLAGDESVKNSPEFAALQECHNRAMKTRAGFTRCMKIARESLPFLASFYARLSSR